MIKNDESKCCEFMLDLLFSMYFIWFYWWWTNNDEFPHLIKIKRIEILAPIQINIASHRTRIGNGEKGKGTDQQGIQRKKFMREVWHYKLILLPIVYFRTACLFRYQLEQQINCWHLSSSPMEKWEKGFVDNDLIYFL